MKNINIIALRHHAELIEKAAEWFSAKWEVPFETYKESISACVTQKTEVPQWYIVLDTNNQIIAGAGVIDNDFHNRKDLTPNLCALYVEKTHRNKKIAKYILEFVRQDFSQLGIEKLYLITDHAHLYERYGWRFLTMVQSDEGSQERMYVTDTSL